MFSLTHQSMMLAESNFSVELFLLIALALPAWIMACIDSSFLVLYLIAMWAFGPEVRRVNDWMGGAYQSLTVLSLIPFVATGALLVPILRYMNNIPRQLRRGLTLIAAALGYGTALGLLLSGIGGMIEGLSMLQPLFFVLYAASRRYDERERRAWLKSMFIISVLVAIYGWYQYVTAPQWDMDWMMESRMYTSMGRPEPMGFRVFSTVNAAAPLGLFMAAAMVVGLCNRTWRGGFGIIGLLLIGTCLLLTQVRTAWIMVVVAVITFIMISKGASRWVSILSVVAVGILINFALPLLPGGSAVAGRLQSFGSLDNDNSTHIRLNMLSSFGAAVTDPLGHGFGSTGVGAKVTNLQAGAAQGTDNGYLDLCITLGLPMTLVLLIGITMLGKEASRFAEGYQEDLTVRSPYNYLSTAMLAAYAASMLSYNNLGGIGGVLLWLPLACPLHSTPPAEINSSMKQLAKPRLRRNRRNGVLSQDASE